MRLLAGWVPRWKDLLSVVGEAESDELQDVASHVSLHRLCVAILHVTSEEEQTLIFATLVDDVQGRCDLVPTRDVAVLHTAAELVLPAILLQDVGKPCGGRVYHPFR